MNTDKFLKMKQQVDQLKREKDRSEGALEQLVKELKSEFNCKTLKEARIERDRLQQEEQELETSFANALEQLETDYPELVKEE